MIETKFTFVSGDLTYLACPYSHKDESVREHRFKLVSIAAGMLMSQGLHVYSPISHSHPIAKMYGLPTDFEYWKEFCKVNLSRCDSMVILTLDGWKESVGVQGEIKMANEFGIPVYAWPIEVWGYVINVFTKR